MQRVLVHRAIFNDDDEVTLVILKQSNISRGIAVDQQHVRPGALLNYAQLCFLIRISLAAHREGWGGSVAGFRIALSAKLFRQ